MRNETNVKGAALDGLIVTNLRKQYGDDTAVDSISFRVPEGDIVALLGPSGCGKTTTLRCIAGLETPTSGTISLGGRVVYSNSDAIDTSPEKRGVGLVFQSYALWPHMTVFENVAYGLRVAKRPRAEITERVHNILQKVELAGMHNRYPSTLSGGQQQRVALARSLVMEPRMLMFDEPLSNLDLKLRESMRLELRDIMKRTGLTCVYVTHDQQEAMVVADKMILMHDGHVVQEDTPQNVYSHPQSTFAAKFVGSVNLLSVASTTPRNDASYLEINAANGRQLLVKAADAVAPDSRQLVAIRPESLEVINPGNGASDPSLNRIDVTVVQSTFLGNLTYYDVDWEGIALKLQTTWPHYSIGDQLAVSIHPDSITLIEEDRN